MAEKNAVLKERNSSGPEPNCSTSVDPLHLNSTTVDPLYLSSFLNLKFSTNCWTIKNCNFCPRNGLIKSPIFTCNFTTNVHFSLELSLESTGEYIDIVRHQVDENSGEMLLVNWKLCISTKEEENVYETEIEHTFGPRCRKRIELPKSVIVYLYPEGTAKSDTLLVTSEVFTQSCESEKSKRQSVANVDCHLLQLSKDFANFFERGDKGNVSLTAKDGEFKIHETIVSARSSSFYVNVDKETGEVNISYPDMSVELLKKMFLYIYSGAFDFAGFKRSDLFDLQLFADMLVLHPLMDLLKPDITAMFTEMQVQHCEFKWMVRDFKFHHDHCKGFLRSPSFRCGNPSSPETWFLKLNFKNSEDCIGIELAVKGLRAKMLAWAEIRAEGLNRSVLFNGIVKDESGFSCSRFLLSKTFQNRKYYFVFNNILCIVCNLKISDMTVRRQLVENHEMNHAISKFEEKSLRKLSDDYYNLLESEENTDFYIKSCGKTYPVHYSVLRARCKTFNLKFEDYIKKNKCYLIDIKAYIMKKIIVFLYSGRLEFLSPYDAIDMYFAGEKYKLHVVQNLCSHYLRSHLTVNTVAKVLMLAKKVNDPELKSSALNYVLSNWDDVLTTEEWENLKNERPDISGEVLYELQKLKRPDQSE